jgi:hypothetical protein
MPLAPLENHQRQLERERCEARRLLGVIQRRRPVRFRPRRHHLVRRAKNESGASLSIVRRPRLHSNDRELFSKALTAAIATLEVADALQRARLLRVSTNIANPKTIADRFTQLRIVNRPPSTLNLFATASFAIAADRHSFCFGGRIGGRPSTNGRQTTAKSLILFGRSGRI